MVFLFFLKDYHINPSLLMILKTSNLLLFINGLLSSYITVTSFCSIINIILYKYKDGIIKFNSFS